jgi:hypothetical protein
MTSLFGIVETNLKSSHSQPNLNKATPDMGAHFHQPQLGYLTRCLDAESAQQAAHSE